MTLASVWSGHPEITELVIVRPVLSRAAAARAHAGPIAPRRRSPPRPSADDAVAIEHVSVTDGTIVFSNLRDRVENRIEGINADASDRRRSQDPRSPATRAPASTPLKFDIKAAAPAPPVERQNIPVELTLDAPGLLQAPLSAKAEVRLNGAVVMINGLTGTLGDGAFNGWASVDLASKPLVKLDLDFQRLDVAMSHRAAADAAARSPGATRSIDLNGLNYVDAQARISAAELNIGDGAFRAGRDRRRRWPAAC